MSDQDFLDFDLLIESHGSGHRARVLDSPAGTTNVEFTFPFGPFEVENFVLKLSQRRGSVRRLESQSQASARAFGQRLYNAVFSGDVELCYSRSLDEARRRGTGLRIRLRLDDPALGNIPWEYLHSDRNDDFLVLSSRTPIVRYLELPALPSPEKLHLPLKVLVVIASPNDQAELDVEQEWQRLNEAASDRIASGQLELVRLSDGSLATLRRELRRNTYHIVHFIGHGAYDEEYEDGALLFEALDGSSHVVPGRDLGTILHDHTSLRLVMLNACEGARSSVDDHFAGSAQSLIRKGMPAVIAMQFEITDEAAIALAHDFYGALVDGWPVDAALAEARKGVFALGNQLEWATPVLYLRTRSDQVFDIDQAVPLPPIEDDGTPEPEPTNIRAAVLPPSEPPIDEPPPLEPAGPPSEPEPEPEPVRQAELPAAAEPAPAAGGTAGPEPTPETGAPPPTAGATAGPEPTPETGAPPPWVRHRAKLTAGIGAAAVAVLAIGGLVLFTGDDNQDDASATETEAAAPTTELTTTTTAATTTTTVPTTTATTVPTSPPTTAFICAGLCAHIEEVEVLADGEFEIIWEAVNYSPPIPSIGDFHAHFFYDIYEPNQAGTNWAQQGASSRGAWHLTDNQPFQTGGSNVDVGRAPTGATRLCVVSADSAHGVINPENAECVDIETGELLGRYDQ